MIISCTHFLSHSLWGKFHLKYFAFKSVCIYIQHNGTFQLKNSSIEKNGGKLRLILYNLNQRIASPSFVKASLYINALLKKQIILPLPFGHENTHLMAFHPKEKWSNLQRNAFQEERFESNIEMGKIIADLILTSSMSIVTSQRWLVLQKVCVLNNSRQISGLW